MKVVILAGGFGTRLSEYTKTIPKPMININGKPMIYHIMKLYSKYGFREFYIALGYKGEVIKKFFKKKKLWMENKPYRYRNKNYDRRKIKTFKKIS